VRRATACGDGDGDGSDIHRHGDCGHNYSCGDGEKPERITEKEEQGPGHCPGPQRLEKLHQEDDLVAGKRANTAAPNSLNPSKPVGILSSMRSGPVVRNDDVDARERVAAEHTP
jgi:hypothetical protein